MAKKRFYLQHMAKNRFFLQTMAKNRFFLQTMAKNRFYVLIMHIYTLRNMAKNRPRIALHVWFSLV